MYEKDNNYKDVRYVQTESILIILNTSLIFFIVIDSSVSNPFTLPHF